MNVEPAKYTWRGIFKYSVGAAPKNPTWRFDRESNWKLELTAHANWALPDRAKSILSRWSLLKQALVNIGAQTPLDPKFLKWLAGKTNGDAPAVTQGVAVMLNNIVAQGTVEPFKIVATFVRRHLIVETKKLPTGSPCWFYLKLSHELTHLEEYLLMLPEWFYVLPNSPSGELKVILKDNKELKKALQRLQAVRIMHEYSVSRYARHDKDSVEISLRDEVTVVPYLKGRICCALPIPGKPSTDKWKGAEPASVLTPEVVVASPNVESCLNSLTRIWQDRFAKSVLISAPPGSGKEAYAGSIPFGNGRASDKLLAIPLTSGDTASLERQLFGRRREDGSIEQGLISKAANTAVFLDEVHQPVDKAGIRASLLRPLESDEYFPAESNKAERVDNVLFVLATSKSLKVLGKIEPIDFWTRMTHVVAIKHPLDYNEKRNGSPSQKEVLQCFFKCFWWDRLEKFYKIDPARLTSDEEHAAIWLKVQQVRLLLQEQTLEAVSLRFAERLLAILKRKRRRPRDFSVRGIRSVVSRMFSTAASDIIRGESRWYKNFNSDLDSVIEEVCFVALLGEVKPRTRPSNRAQSSHRKRSPLKT